MTELYPQLQRYTWPGNIRELLGVAERIAILAEHEFPMEIDAALMVEEHGIQAASLTVVSGNEEKRKLVSEYRYEEIVLELKRQKYHKQKTADALGISRSTLWRLIKKYEIPLE